MSYRAAWGRLKASEERLGIKLVEMDNVKHGMHLTDEAKKLIDCFDQLERDIASILNENHRKLLSNLSRVSPKKASGRT
jgi:molybdate transport system regulatory protein